MSTDTAKALKKEDLVNLCKSQQDEIEALKEKLEKQGESVGTLKNKVQYKETDGIFGRLEAAAAQKNLSANEYARKIVRKALGYS